MYPYVFTAIIYDRYSCPDNKHIYFYESGMGLCSCYADACAQLETYYGDDLIRIRDLALLEENNILILDAATVKAYEDGAFENSSNRRYCTVDGMPCEAPSKEG